MTVYLQLPEGVGGEPVVVVAIQHYGRVGADARLSQELAHLLGGQDVARKLVVELGRPVPADGARDVALVISLRVNVNFDEPHARIAKVLGDPLGRHDRFGVCNACHFLILQLETHSGLRFVFWLVFIL